MIFQCFISNKCRLDEHMILISKTLKIVGFLSKRLTSTVHSLINIIDSVFFFFLRVEVLRFTKANSKCV